MKIRMLKSPHTLLGVMSLLGTAATLPGCGLYAEAPAFSGADASPIISGLSDAGVDADADTESRADVGSPDALVECVIRDEVCDGLDDDCDGFVDNLFEGGQIAVGATHTCATRPAGTLYCWGGNERGQLGIGSTIGRAQPTRLPTSDQLPKADQLSAGEHHTCMISSADASVWCWGANAHGQLGDGSTDVRLNPVQASFPQTPLRVAAGRSHTCVLDATQYLHCWGDNSAGQLGVEGGEAAVLTPTPAVTEHSFKSIAAGDSHTCGVTSDGMLYCWGDNAEGQLGVGDFEARAGATSPTAMPESSDFGALAAAGAFTCGMHSSGSVYCWGGGESTPRPFRHSNGSPIDFSGASITVASSGEFCALNAVAGTLFCGDIGEGSVSALSQNYRLAILAAGFDHICGINQEGRAYCWGDNHAGQIGTGTQGGTVPAPLVASCK